MNELKRVEEHGVWCKYSSIKKTSWKSHRKNIVPNRLAEKAFRKGLRACLLNFGRSSRELPDLEVPFTRDLVCSTSQQTMWMNGIYLVLRKIQLNFKLFSSLSVYVKSFESKFWSNSKSSVITQRRLTGQHRANFFFRFAAIERIWGTCSSSSILWNCLFFKRCLDFIL